MFSRREQAFSSTHTARHVVILQSAVTIEIRRTIMGWRGGNPGASAQPRGMHGKSRRHVGSTGPYLVRQRADCVRPRNSRRPSRPSSATFPSIMCETPVVTRRSRLWNTHDLSNGWAAAAWRFIEHGPLVGCIGGDYTLSDSSGRCPSIGESSWIFHHTSSNAFTKTPNSCSRAAGPRGLIRSQFCSRVEDTRRAQI